MQTTAQQQQQLTQLQESQSGHHDNSSPFSNQPSEHSNRKDYENAHNSGFFSSWPK